jgi:hypothetical protein
MVAGVPPSRLQTFFNCGPLPGEGSMQEIHRGLSPSSTPNVGYTSSIQASASFSINAASGAQHRVRSIVHGIMSPFKACVVPPIEACVVPNASWDENYRPHFAPPTAHPRYANKSERVPSAVLQQQHPSLHSPAVSPHQRPCVPACIDEPSYFDVLLGRGGASANHSGNLHFRQLIAANRTSYPGLTKKQKMLLARQIVDIVRGTDPPGRFLARDGKTGYYYDVGLPRSLEKTSQALREKSSTDRTENDPMLTRVDSVLSDTPTPVSPRISDSCLNQTKPKSRTVETPTLHIPPDLESIYRVPHKEGRILPPQQIATSPELFSDSPHYYHHHRHPVVSPYHHLQNPALESPPYGSLATIRNGYSSLPPFRPLQRDRPYRPPLAPSATPRSCSQRPPILIVSPSAAGVDDQPEWKRQRIDRAGHTLSQQMSSRLTLEERVVGKREPRKSLVAPSSVGSSRRHNYQQQPLRVVSSQEHDTTMDGLAALSTAAFLRLDETH